MDLTGFYRVLLVFTGFYWILLGFTGFYWVSRVSADVRQAKPTEPAACFLSDCRKLHFAFTPNYLLHEPRRLAGLKVGPSIIETGQPIRTHFKRKAKNQKKTLRR